MGRETYPKQCLFWGMRPELDHWAFFFIISSKTMASDETMLIADKLTSNCTGTYQEHEQILQQLLSLCAADRLCVASNMKRMRLICKHKRDLQRPQALMFFHKVIGNLQKNWHTSRTQVIQQFSASWRLPEQTIHRRFKLSQHLDNVRKFLVLPLPFPSSSTGRQGERMISIGLKNAYILNADGDDNVYTLHIWRLQKPLAPSKYIWCFRDSLADLDHPEFALVPLELADLYDLLLDLFNDVEENTVLENVVENEFDFRRLIVDVQKVKLFSDSAEEFNSGKWKVS